MGRDRARAGAWETDRHKKVPSGSALRAQFDTTISPIGDPQSTVKQECCAILCDVVRCFAIVVVIKRREFIASRGGGLVCGASPKFNGFVLRRGGPSAACAAVAARGSTNDTRCVGARGRPPRRKPPKGRPYEFEGCAIPSI